MVTMLFKTNIFGIVGSDNNPEYKQNTVIIWDDFKKQKLVEYKAKEKVLNLKLRTDKIIIVCKTKIYSYNLKDFQFIGIIETGNNPLGLIGINYTKDNPIIVYPSNDSDKDKLL